MISADNQMQMFLHCKKCIAEVLEGQAPGESPESYARLSVGWTVQGLQVWCVRHDCNVVHIDFEGQKHPANTRSTDPVH